MRRDRALRPCARAGDRHAFSVPLTRVLDQPRRDHEMRDEQGRHKQGEDVPRHSEVKSRSSIRLPWTKALTRSAMPSRLKIQTTADANRHRVFNATIESNASPAAMRSPYPAGTANSRGRLGSTTVGTSTVRPRVRVR